MQVSVKDASFRQEALNLIRNAPTLGGKAQMHLLLTALRGKAAGFEKVVAMIDDMVALLKKEQVDDEEKKEYCEAQFDSLDDKKKALERSSSDLETQLDEVKDRIATLAKEIESFQSSLLAAPQRQVSLGSSMCLRIGSMVPEHSFCRHPEKFRRNRFRGRHDDGTKPVKRGRMSPSHWQKNHQR